MNFYWTHCMSLNAFGKEAMLTYGSLQRPELC